jgi:hypothetical protein
LDAFKTAVRNFNLSKTLSIKILKEQNENLKNALVAKAQLTKR